MSAKKKEDTEIRARRLGEAQVRVSPAQIKKLCACFV